MSIAEIAVILRRFSDELPVTEVVTAETALAEIIAELATTLAGTRDPDAVAVLTELRAARRVLRDAHAELVAAAGGCREYLSRLGA
ncbi:hypothetical protein [Plantactinospora sp. B5E13]|uniref:hypothetical protein n=1 Tax=unclassified Plantactinospora TaxID=2631981 RepID=UPI00325CAA98